MIPPARMRPTSAGDGLTSAALELIGKRWTLLIVRALAIGPRRFSALKACLPGISANVLAKRVRELETASIVVRRRMAAPADVWVYDLTEHGRELGAVVETLVNWAAQC